MAFTAFVFFSLISSRLRAGLVPLGAACVRSDRGRLVGYGLKLELVSIAPRAMKLKEVNFEQGDWCKDSKYATHSAANAFLLQTKKNKEMSELVKAVTLQADRSPGGAVIGKELRPL